jgi:hypothetical protein
VKPAPKITELSLTRTREIDNIRSFADRIWNAARMYCELGWYVVPLERGSKKLAFDGAHYSMASRNVETIDSWFNPEGGKYAGHNLGLATGRSNGLFALDIDKKDNVDGFESLDEILLEDGAELPDCPVQSSPSGGKHYIFRWQENAVSSTGKLGPGLDPSFILSRLGVSWSHRKGEYVRGLEGATDPDFEEIVPISQVVRMLRAIDPDELEYEEWLRVGMAIYSQHPDEHGLEAWDQWSATGRRYKQGECHKRWQGLPNTGNVRIASLFYFARQSGWEPQPKDVTSNPLAIVTERMNEKNAVVMLGGKIRVLHELDGEMSLMDQAYHLMTPYDFKVLYQNDKVLVGTDKPKAISVADLWLADPKRRQYTKGVGLFPGGAPSGYYNAWRGFHTVPREGSCEKWLFHLREVLCRGHDDYYEFLLDWCADLFQDPGNPKGVAIVFRGGEGTGKGTFGNTLCHMCAPHATHLIDEEHLTGKFNSHLAQSIVCFADEITWGGHKKTAGKLKGLVTERFLVLERKGVDAVAHENMIHLVVASNNAWVIPAGMDSRRWFVLDVAPTYQKDPEYFKALYHELENGGREAFLHMMQEREITHHLSRAPQTEGLQEQRAMTAVSEDIVGTWWRSVIERGMLPLQDNDTPQAWPDWASTISRFLPGMSPRRFTQA